MSFIECYEPEFVRNFLAQHPGSPLYVRKVWKNEIRQSLALTEIASCEAVLNDANAFALQLTYRQAETYAPAIPVRQSILNQVILSTLALPDLSPEIALYAVGILLSRATKMPGNDGDMLARLTILPQALADHAQKGTLQAQFALLPPTPQLPRQLLALLGHFDFDWSVLPESPRKARLPLQVSLLTLQDANSEALLYKQLQEKWQTSYELHFIHKPWLITNYLIYLVYHDLIPMNGEESYFHLASDFFFIRTLLTLWTLDDSALAQEDIFALFSMFERWRVSENAVVIRQQIQSLCSADLLLSAFSLLK